jgi:hypothetical protein
VEAATQVVGDSCERYHFRAIIFPICCVAAFLIELKETPKSCTILGCTVAKSGKGINFFIFIFKRAVFYFSTMIRI